MNYLHYKCKVKPEHFIQVSLSAKANIRLLDTVNFYKYQTGKPYETASEHLDISSVEIKVPFKSTWHVVIEHGFYEGTIKANVKVV
ncbi:MAG: DUF1883 domain-containing protein [Spirochaetales bacterium]|jgi:hypothetical protein|nr:DUF1883 domain-containing protein [Spirochaetales bacterium]